jgi:thiazole/oxazole-forming peptide maturase SagD family component
MILMNWKLNLSTSVGRNNHRLSGVSSSSGKGLTREAATASGFMEMLERYSAAEGCTPNWSRGYVNDMNLRRARMTELQRDGIQVFDPNTLNLRMPYEDQEIYWVLGERFSGEIYEPLFVPAQLVFTYSNLDEPEIVRGSANGLASGNTLNEARLHAIGEIVERDGDYTVFYSPKKCFVLDAGSGQVKDILEAYRSQGIEVQFLDLTTELGIPTYRAFVNGNGHILSGSGAHLDGRIAATRALCELGPKCWVYERIHKNRIDRSQPQSPQVRKYEELPNYSSGNVNGDVDLLQRFLFQNGYPPVFVNLTRSDIQVPVVRGIVPRLDIPEGLTQRQFLNFLSTLS